MGGARVLLLALIAAAAAATTAARPGFRLLDGTFCTGDRKKAATQADTAAACAESVPPEGYGFEWEWPTSAPSIGGRRIEVVELTPADLAFETYIVKQS